jgi:hypothetical protein
MMHLLLTGYQLMTSADRNDLMQQLMPAQGKLEWITPKISLMEAEETMSTGKPLRYQKELVFRINGRNYPMGNS